MTDTKDDPAPMTADQRARTAAMEVMIILLLRRIAAATADPKGEIGRFETIALAEAATAAGDWRTLETDVKRAIRGLCEDAAAGLS